MPRTNSQPETGWPRKVDERAARCHADAPPSDVPPAPLRGELLQSIPGWIPPPGRPTARRMPRRATRQWAALYRALMGAGARSISSSRSPKLARSRLHRQRRRRARRQGAAGALPPSRAAAARSRCSRPAFRKLGRRAACSARSSRCPQDVPLEGTATASGMQKRSGCSGWVTGRARTRRPAHVVEDTFGVRSGRAAARRPASSITSTLRFARCRAARRSTIPAPFTAEGLARAPTPMSRRPSASRSTASRRRASPPTRCT